jgi:hypothetical protein
MASAGVRFAHPSERLFASLLDAFGVAWAYEPRTFVLAEDDLGAPIEAFTPDFHLVDHDVYVEITTVRQPLVTRKNRKVRRLRERYPDVQLTVLYRRDVEELLGRHGLVLG